MEVFELEIQGGAVERRYRERRPETDQMPWGTLDVSAFSPAEIAAARAGWTDLALQEYAAAATQAHVLGLALRARAPIDVSAMLTQFPFDEIVHTEICARMAEELGGATRLEYPTDEVFPSPSAGRGTPLLQAAKAVAWEFCVGETLSLGMLRTHHRTAQQPLLRDVWGRLRKDEAAHARFGWLFLEWALPALSAGDRRELGATVARAVKRIEQIHEKVHAQPDEAFAPIGVFGSLGRSEYLARSRAVLEVDVVRRFHAR
jgi:hypothetical protein